MPYTSGKINIPLTSGNIEIIVTTEAIEQEIVNLFNVNETQINMRWGSNSPASRNGAFITNAIYADPGDVLYIKNTFGNNSVYSEGSSASVQKITAVSSTGTKVDSQAALLNRGSIFPIDGDTTYTGEKSGTIGSITVPTSWTTAYDHIELTFLANTSSTTISTSDISNVIITKNQPLS